MLSLSSVQTHKLTEGPHWDERTGCLWYVDIPAGDVCKLNPTTKEYKSINVGDAASLVVPYQSSSDHLVVAMKKEIRKLEWPEGRTETLAEVEKDKPHNRFNDGKCDKMGRLWAGTLGKELSVGICEAEGGGLYSIDGNSRVKKQDAKVTLSNGMTWSLDWQKMFYVDSTLRCVYVFDYDLQNGSLSNQRVFLDFNTNPAYQDCAFPDGMTHDISGRLWLACFGAGRVVCIDPETGALLRTINIPAKNTTSCCFGGPDYSELYVTSARIHITEAELQDQPDSGGVFRVTGLGTRGMPAYNFGC